MPACPTLYFDFLFIFVHVIPPNSVWNIPRHPELKKQVHGNDVQVETYSVFSFCPDFIPISRSWAGFQFSGTIAFAKSCCFPVQTLLVWFWKFPAAFAIPPVKCLCQKK